MLSGSLVFAAGFTSLFALLGAAAGTGMTLRTTGLTFERWAAGVVLVVACVLVVDAQHGRIRAHRFGLPALGAAFAAALAASVGPFLARVLVLASNTSSGVWGAVLLLVYAVGLLLPFLVCTLAVAGSDSAIRRVAARGVSLSLSSALLLAAVAAVLALGRYSAVTNWLDRVLPFATP
jgi:cytochrome c-type biogenesis protein